MLELINIAKKYQVGDQSIEALKSISINFRNQEFVSILGPSGCGKTTLLNIIGGLDQYTSGQLKILGTDTTKYKDRDWDNYRNHCIGFIFQSYNLIPHQSVLGNVELALTLTGMSKTKRREKALKALAEVGLADQVYKKPNQLSGGQMQRVAIARAIVNDPQVILADEPTGALDTQTSLQIMEILKRISLKCLVIMVTHNPDLAQNYSTRIIKLVDGLIVDDTNPYLIETNQDNQEELKESNKQPINTNINNTVINDCIIKSMTTMSFLTALSLSFKNLLQKKARTLMTVFAGSIGIIGIALILSLSSGFSDYVDRLEKDTLSSYPLTIQSETSDYSEMLASLNRPSTDQDDKEPDKVYSKEILAQILQARIEGVRANDLKSLKSYLENYPNIKDYVTTIKYTYNVNLRIFQEQQNSIVQLLPFRIDDRIGNPISTSNIWQELIDNQQLLEKQYNVLAGHWPTSKEELVIVIDKSNELNDFMMYALGLKEYQEVALILKSVYEDDFEYTPSSVQYDYQDLLNMTYKLVLISQYYQYDQETGLWGYKGSDSEYMIDLITNHSLELKISGVVQLKEDVSSGAISSTIGYSRMLTEYIVNANANSDLVKAQLASPDINILNGEPLLPPALKSQLISFGWADYETPNTISLYPNSFESKEKIIAIIDQFNQERSAEEQIIYTDYVAKMMESIGKIISSITYVLIAFVAISLIVSSFMIGIITYISVIERIKEIGVLRSIGASKKDITRVFNAETLIIGFGAGVMGVLIAMVLNFPVNIIIDKITGIGNVASVPPWGAILLVVISMSLTFVAGLIPARIAATKDPVVALRSE